MGFPKPGIAGHARWGCHRHRVGRDARRSRGLESAHYDCFPSGHGELKIIAWWSTRQISKRLFRVYLAHTPCIIFATVYLRYHCTVDLLAGALLAAVLIAAGPMMCRKLSGREDSIAA